MNNKKKITTKKKKKKKKKKTYKPKFTSFEQTNRLTNIFSMLYIHVYKFVNI
jgi:hypothetical protein